MGGIAETKTATTTTTSSLFHPFLLKVTLRFNLHNNAGGAGNPK